MIAHDWPSAIAYANEIRAARVLIVCHAADRYLWLQDWPKYSTMLQYLPKGAPLGRYAVQTRRGGVNEDAAVTSISPQLMRGKSVGIRRVLDRIPFDLVIADCEDVFPISDNWKRVLPIVPQLEAAA